MRLTKYMNIFIMIMTSLIILVACEESDPDDVEEPTLVGSWLLSKVVMRDTPVGTLNMTADGFLGQSGTGAQTSTLTLNEDGTASVTTTFAASADTTEAGTWVQDEDQLIIENAGINATVPFQMDATSLTLTLIFPIDFLQNGEFQDIQVDMIYDRL